MKSHLPYIIIFDIDETLIENDTFFKDLISILKTNKIKILN